jgi:hypothetical protein
MGSENTARIEEHVALFLLILADLGARCSMIGLVGRYWKPVAAVFNNKPTDARSVKLPALIP